MIVSYHSRHFTFWHVKNYDDAGDKFVEDLLLQLRERQIYLQPWNALITPKRKNGRPAPEYGLAHEHLGCDELCYVSRLSYNNQCNYLNFRLQHVSEKCFFEKEPKQLVPEDKSPDFSHVRSLILDEVSSLDVKHLHMIQILLKHLLKHRKF